MLQLDDIPTAASLAPIVTDALVDADTNDDDEAIDTHPDKEWSPEYIEVGFLLNLVPNLRATLLNDLHAKYRVFFILL